MKFAGLKVGDEVVVEGFNYRPIRRKVTKVGRKWFTAMDMGDFSLETGATRSGFSGKAITVAAYEAAVRAGNVRRYLKEQGYELSYHVSDDKVVEVYEALVSAGTIAAVRA